MGRQSPYRRENPRKEDGMELSAGGGVQEQTELEKK